MGGSGSTGHTHKRRTAPAQPQQHPAKRQAFERQQNVSGDGRLATNRRGIPLCKGFQDNSCKEINAHQLCAAGGRHAHQCANCRSPEEGADG